MRSLFVLSNVAADRLRISGRNLVRAGSGRRRDGARSVARGRTAVVTAAFNHTKVAAQHRD